MSEPDICIFVSQLVVFGGYIMSITYWTVNIRSLMICSTRIPQLVARVTF